MCREQAPLSNLALGLKFGVHLTLQEAGFGLYFSKQLRRLHTSFEEQRDIISALRELPVHYVLESHNLRWMPRLVVRHLEDTYARTGTPLRVIQISVESGETAALVSAPGTYRWVPEDGTSSLVPDSRGEPIAPGKPMRVEAGALRLQSGSRGALVFDVPKAMLGGNRFFVFRRGFSETR